MLIKEIQRVTRFEWKWSSPSTAAASGKNAAAAIVGAASTATSYGVPLAGEGGRNANVAAAVDGTWAWDWPTQGEVARFDQEVAAATAALQQQGMCTTYSTTHIDPTAFVSADVRWCTTSLHAARFKSRNRIIKQKNKKKKKNLKNNKKEKVQK